MAFTYPNSKGFVYTFQSFSLLEGSTLFAGLLGFKASPKLEGRKLVFGTGRTAYGRTRGQLSVECELTFLSEAFFDFVKANPQFLDQSFDFTGVCEEGANRNKIQVYSMAFESADIPFEGTDEIKVVVPGMAMNMKIDDKFIVEGDALGIKNDAGAV